MDKDKYATANEAGFEQVEHASNGSSPDLCLNPSVEVSYGESGIRGVVKSPYVFGAAFLASLGGFSFGYDQSVMMILICNPDFLLTIPIGA